MAPLFGKVCRGHIFGRRYQSDAVSGVRARAFSSSGGAASSAPASAGDGGICPKTMPHAAVHGRRSPICRERVVVSAGGRSAGNIFSDQPEELGAGNYINIERETIPEKNGFRKTPMVERPPSAPSSQGRLFKRVATGLRNLRGRVLGGR